jgi:protein-tyrosine phosphatase
MQHAWPTSRGRSCILPAVDTEQRRHLVLAGTRNLRDVGGYPTRDGRRVRWRTLYRSDCLDQLTELSQGELLALGVRTIIDLRDNQEVLERPNVLAASAAVRYRRLPIWDEPPPGDRDTPPDLERGYVRPLDERGEQLAAVCRALLEPGALPVLVHCAAGKDRTGVVVALLLAVAGVEPEDIAADYALSAACLGEAYQEEGRRELAGRGLAWDSYGYLYATPPERMLKTLAYLDERWGGAERYLLRQGLAADELAALRARLTEPAQRAR